MKRIITIIAILALSGIAAAQYNETNNLFYHTFRTPQSNKLNPAFYPNKNTFYLSLPGIEGQFGSPLAINDIMYTQGDTATVIDINKMLTALTNDNRFRLNMDVDIFGFGFKVHQTFFTFSTRLVNSVNVGLPISLINALRQGNVDENNNPIPEVTLIDGSLFNAQSYAELTIGAGHHFEPINLTVGARAKVLFGVGNIQTDNSRAVFITDENYERVKVDLYYQVQTATAVSLDTGAVYTVSDIIDPGKANMGLSFDIGARYDLGPFSFSLAINDLSAGIHWRNNVSTFEPESGHTTLEFSGEDVTLLLNGGQLNADTIANTYVHLLEGMRPVRNTTGDYWYSIPTKINLGASYNFAKMLRAGILFHGQFDRGLLSKKNPTQLDLGDGVANTFRFNTTLSFGANLFNWAEVMVGSSIVYDGDKLSVFNPGAGLILTPGTIFQIYLMADYISSFYLVEAKAFNVKFGLNLLFGNGGGARITQN